MKFPGPARPDSQTAGLQAASEHRFHPRVSIPFPTTVEGVDVDGEHFKVNTVADNLSRGGIYFRLMPCVAQGATLNVVFLLDTSPVEQEKAHKVQSEVKVLRVEEKAGGACGVAARFLSSKLF